MSATETQSQKHLLYGIALTLLVATFARAQETPYFVTYDHHMEEPGNLEISIAPVFATPREGASSVASSLELEYGTAAWWTTSLYLDGVRGAGTSPLFTGYRVENRFRLLMDEHLVNPVLYVEYARTNGADRVAREIVGFDSSDDFAEPLSDVRHEHDREVEAKLILSSNVHGWNFSGNAIAEKNLAGAPWEYGYAIATSRPLALAASPDRCSFCAENFSLGIEIYGGAGEQHNLTLAGTSHYVAPAVSWALPSGVTLRFSPGWGITGESNRSFIRFGISYEGKIR